MGKIIKSSDDILDKQLGLLPKEIKFCNNCVVSNQRPRIGIKKLKVNAQHVIMHMKRII